MQLLSGAPRALAVLEVPLPAVPCPPQCAHAARATLRAGAKAAASRVLDLIASDDERIALSAAQTLLDRTGHPKAERLEMSAEVEASARVTVDPGDALAAMLAGAMDE